MNILMIGIGKGSFDVRGKQLGRALGARVAKMPYPADLEWADVVVLIKHAYKYARWVHAWKKPLVWDALDFWRQPDQNVLTEAQSRTLLHSHLRTIKPTLMIGATEAMAQAGDGVYLPHHMRRDNLDRGMRPEVLTVAYEGTRKYLGRWWPVLQANCDRRGWYLMAAPLINEQADIRIAVRDDPWDGWMCREWKSGVKLVNAISEGVPVITQETAAFREIRPAGGTIEDYGSLSAALDAFVSPTARLSARAYCGGEAPAYRIGAIAERYRQILASVARKAA